ncbi:MAG: hypothetical protein GY863_23660 [bacterium]|nr:hypothetical protein [bacterium]
MQNDIDDKKEPIEQPGLFKRFKNNIRVFRKMILSWILIIILLSVGLYFNLDKKILGVGLIVVAYFTAALSGLMVLIGAVPILGPVLVKILSLPFFWILNGIGYFASIVAIKKGHSKEVITYRILTIVFLFGVIVGYILSRLFK